MENTAGYTGKQNQFLKQVFPITYTYHRSMWNFIDGSTNSKQQGHFTTKFLSSFEFASHIIGVL